MKDLVLVTGGSGFVGSYCIVHLLKKGYQVNTTVRSMSKKNDVIEMLESEGIASSSNLTFYEADLSEDDNWEIAMQGCKYVLSVASPVFFQTPKDERAAIRPALEGTLRILKYAKKGNVKRVVMTSNFGAVGFSHTDKHTETTEADWTDPDLRGLSVYEKSKILAEQAAWDFIKNEGGELEFSTINPVAILGPSLIPHISASFKILEHLIDGSIKVLPKIPLNIVDVRDVADLHIRAMITPDASGQRFIATADGKISIPEIAYFLKKEMPNIAKKVPTKIIPDWLIELASLFNPKAKEAATLLKVNRNISNAKAKKILNWTPIATQEEAILASLNSMIKYGIIG